MLRGDRHELARHPGVIRVGKLESRERILAVRIESGRDEQDLRLVPFERRQPVLAHGGAKLLASGTRRQRDVDHVRGRMVEPR